MSMEAGLNWHRTLPSGMLRYEYGGWLDWVGTGHCLVVCSGMSMEAGLNWHRT